MELGLYTLAILSLVLFDAASCDSEESCDTANTWLHMNVDLQKDLNKRLCNSQGHCHCSIHGGLQRQNQEKDAHFA